MVLRGAQGRAPSTHLSILFIFAELLLYEGHESLLDVIYLLINLAYELNVAFVMEVCLQIEQSVRRLHLDFTAFSLILELHVFEDDLVVDALEYLLDFREYLLMQYLLLEALWHVAEAAEDLVILKYGRFKSAHNMIDQILLVKVHDSL